MSWSISWSRRFQRPSEKVLQRRRNCRIFVQNAWSVTHLGFGDALLTWVFEGCRITGVKRSPVQIRPARPTEAPADAGVSSRRREIQRTTRPERRQTLCPRGGRRRPRRRLASPARAGGGRSIAARPDPDQDGPQQTLPVRAGPQVQVLPRSGGPGAPWRPQICLANADCMMPVRVGTMCAMALRAA